MVTKAELSKLYELDQEIKSLAADRLKIQIEKGKQLLVVDRKIEKAIAKINTIWVDSDDSGEDEEGEDVEIKNGDRVKITGGVTSTVNMKMTVHSTTKCFYWLKDSKGKMHRRTKTNVEKVIKKE